MEQWKEEFFTDLTKATEKTNPTIPTVPTDAVAYYYAMYHGADATPPIATRWIYGGESYVYNGSSWLREAEQEPSQQPTIGTYDTYTNDISLITTCVLSTNVTDSHIQISGSHCSDGMYAPAGVNLTQLADDVAEIKETLAKLLKSTDTVEQHDSYDEDDEAINLGAKCLSRAIDQEILSELYEEADKFCSYDRAMGLIK